MSLYEQFSSGCTKMHGPICEAQCVGTRRGALSCNMREREREREGTGYEPFEIRSCPERHDLIERLGARLGPLSYVTLQERHDRRDTTFQMIEPLCRAWRWRSSCFRSDVFCARRREEK